MTVAVVAALIFLAAVVVERAFPVMSSVEASERLQAERDERAARAALRPPRDIEVGPRP